MHRETDILVGLSVGTTKVTVIVAGRDPRYQDSVQVIGVGCSPSRGISKGVIVNLNEATESVLNAVRDAENIVGQKLSSAVVAFNSLEVNSVMTEGMVALGGREPSRVEIPDLERVIEAAQSRLSLSKNTLSVHTIPVRYFLDDRSVDEPLNMTGMRLEMALQTVSVPKTYVQNVITCVEDARIHVEGLVIKPLASSLGALTNEEMRIGIVSLSIGGGSTGLVLYQAGRPFKIQSFPIGGDHITNDLAGGLRISLKKAEELKKRLFTEDEETLRREGIDVGLALDVICARVEELFEDHVREALREYKPQLFPGGVVLSGGVARTPGIAEMLSDILKMPARIANPGELYSMPPGREDPSYVSAAGLLRYLLYRRRYPHLFIEPPQTELLPLPRAGAREPAEIYRSPSSGPKWNMKNMLEKLKENLKDLF